MNLEQIFSAMSLLAMVGWLCLLLAPLKLIGAVRVPLRRETWIGAARVVAGLLSLAYVILIVRGLTAPDGPEGGGFDSLAKVMILLSAPATMLPAWIHYLCFDLWVGTWEAEDAPKAGVPHWLLIPVMFGTFMYGPAGLLAYLVIRTIAGRLKAKVA